MGTFRVTMVVECSEECLGCKPVDVNDKVIKAMEDAGYVVHEAACRNAEIDETAPWAFAII